MITAPQRSAALQTLRPIPVLPLPTTATTLAQAAPERDFLVQALFASNFTGTAAEITLHLVPEGGTATTANRIIAARPVAAQTTAIVFDRDAPCLLGPGASLVALCATAAAVTMWGHGTDILGAHG